jgi:protocadherin-15
MEGDITKFAVDPLTGDVKTLQGLDYERAQEHRLVIGTEQSRGLKITRQDSTCTVMIRVTDVNDIPPTFTRLPSGNRLVVQNDAQINDNLTRVSATDGDGTAPGNQVHYQLVAAESSDKAEIYFRVEPDTGDIVLQGDLANELYDEYRLAVRAKDQGLPALETTVQILVTVQQVVTVPPNSGVGFSSLEHDITVMENTPQEAVLKTITLEKKPERNIRIRCDVTEAFDDKNENVRSLFRGELDSNKDCRLILARSGLDHELVEHYRVVLTLNTLSAFVNPKRMRARVNVTVLDKNDNAPRFVYKSDYNKIVKDKYLSTVTAGTPVGETIGQVQAEDLDGGNLGKIKFGISPETNEVVKNYFEINEDTGIVISKKPFADVPDDLVPLRLVISARDNPGNMEDSKMEKTELVINVVREGYLMVLAVRDTAPELMETRRAELTAWLRDQTGMVVNVHHIGPNQLLDYNGTCCTADPTGSDIWFYAVDPETQTLLGYNDTVALRHITSRSAQTSLKYTITGDLHIQASEIRSPHLGSALTTSAPSSTAVTTLAALQYSGYPSVLIAVGCLVFALSFAAIIYLLVLYAK